MSDYPKNPNGDYPEAPNRNNHDQKPEQNEKQSGQASGNIGNPNPGNPPYGVNEGEKTMGSDDDIFQNSPYNETYSENNPGDYPGPTYSQNYGNNYNYTPPQQGRLAEHSKTTTVFVLGILSIVCCQILGPFVWYMGHNAREDIRADPYRYSQNSTLLDVGWVLGIISTVLLLLGVLVYASLVPLSLM